MLNGADGVDGAICAQARSSRDDGVAQKVMPIDGAVRAESIELTIDADIDGPVGSDRGILDDWVLRRKVPLLSAIRINRVKGTVRAAKVHHAIGSHGSG